MVMSDQDQDQGGTTCEVCGLPDDVELEQSGLLNLHKEGNSTVVTIPVDVLQALGLHTGDRVVWKYTDGYAQIEEATMRVGNE